ncbi:MAG: hypothetical protein IPJ47_10115 [Anaerolineales bacterium]|nr:hypothetical protein [Anaerolineales bacterium]
MKDVADLSCICNIVYLFSVHLAVQCPQVAPVQGLCQPTQIHAALAAIFDGDLLEIFIDILALTARFEPPS